jgi:hypothetical protein
VGVDHGGHLGPTGQEIAIAAMEDVEVTTANVLLAQDDSTVIEKGVAVVDLQDPWSARTRPARGATGSGSRSRGSRARRSPRSSAPAAPPPR